MFPTDKTDEYDSRVDVKRAVPRMPILKEREKTHGEFVSNAEHYITITNALYLASHSLLAPYHRLALDMIALKLSRILNGNPNEIDHWKDIAGYATLVVEKLEKKKEK